MNYPIIKVFLQKWRAVGTKSMMPDKQVHTLRTFLAHFIYFTPAEGIRTLIDHSKGLRESFSSTFYPARLTKAGETPRTEGYLKESGCQRARSTDTLILRFPSADVNPAVPFLC